MGQVASAGGRAAATAAPIVRLDVGARISEASVCNGLVHLAGQVANDTAQGIEGQTREVLASVDALLARCGSSKERILMVQVYLPNISRDFAGMNKAYEAWVAKGNQPPRATVQAELADPKWLIEVVVTATNINT
jgi:enamine deaminase RidA (YjgF/YER057c/UK114 family)